MVRSGMPDVTLGAQVVTSDGASLGSVADVRETAFKVDVRMARDYWLGRDYVTESSTTQVTMGSRVRTSTRTSWAIRSER